MKPGARCFFEGRRGAGPCDGRLDRAHWIPQQVLRRELGPGDVCPLCGVSRGRPCQDMRTGAPLRRPHARRVLEQQAVVWDPRVWTPMCRRHHAALDHARTLRVDRAELPPGVEEYASERGLEWFLSREYGEREERAA